MEATIIEKTMKTIDFTEMNSSSMVLSTQNLQLQKALTEELIKKIMGQGSVKNNPDILRLAETDKNSIGIDEIKKLISRLKFKPYQSKRKVAVIENAESMTHEAQNAFLKTLEDIPDRTFIILIVSNHTKLLPTILSRCQLIEVGSEEEKAETYNAEEILKSNLYEKFKIVEEISKIKIATEKREAVNELIKSLMGFYRQDLKSNPKNSEKLKLLQYTLTAINENVNIRLALENLMLNLD